MKKLEDLKSNFFSTAIADTYRAAAGGSYTGAIILTLCIIDYMTWVEYGEKKYGYNTWIENRLEPINIFYQNKAEEIYSVRCGLVHTYGPSKKIIQGEFEGYELLACSPGMHLQRVNNGILKICLYTFLTDVVFAAHLAFEDLKLKVKPKQIERLKKQIVIRSRKSNESYGEMHGALSVFDNPVEITLRNIQADYTKHILYQ